MLHEVSQRPLKVLLVEQDEAQRAEVERLLSEARDPRVDLEWCGYLSDALERLSEGGIDLVLLDLSLPDSEGVATFERMYAFAPDVPVVVLTDLDDEDVAMTTVQGGAQDYLVRDEVRSGILIRSIRYAIERHRLISALRSLSLIDDLTGLYNRRGFAELGEQQLKLARRMVRRVLLLYLDLDRLKTINDSLGHHVGDRALKKTTDLVKASFRRSDLIARIDGDDFAVLALEASKDDAELMTSRFREHVRKFNRTTSEPYQISVSLGVARFDPESPVSLDELTEQARRAMKEEKMAKRPAVRP
ncbi:MAG: GGDEF domain-containing response regulator [Longimicrobiales bacterium]|nr:GGDEF domain-containing response regulator [Longimicrobiales bacterium]